ncbi:MAG: S1C family serine protease [Holosporales bacterium]|jgi:S1-C subfamily serine protease|nr:S1C family serine protease [Holosporales bacterium]
MIAVIVFSTQCTAEPHKTSLEAKSVQNNKKEIDQKDLFNMIRNGVVAIKVRGHVIMERSFNDKMWTGTGFIVDLEKGLIITNSHVAGEMAVCTYEIKFGNGTKTEAKLEYIDPCYDMAVLSVDPKNIPKGSIALEMSDEDACVNTTVYSMGNSYGNEFSTYQGTIFDIYSILWLRVFPEQSIQFSGLTVPGASGSPVFGCDGKVIGLLYGGKLVSGAALPIKYVKPVIASIKKGEYFTRYFYGFMLDYMTLQDAVETGVVPEEWSLEYEKQFPDSNNKILYVSKKLTAFSKEGETTFSQSKEVEAGDVIVSVDGVPIGCKLQKFDDIVQAAKGNSLSMKVYRRGKEKTIKIKTYELAGYKNMKLLSFAGCTFFETNDDVKVIKGTTEKAVYITNSEPGSPFMEVTSPNGESIGHGLFRINMIDNQKVSSLKDVVEILPNLMKKNVFTIRYTKTSGDGEETSVTTKYSPEFVEAMFYSFNEQTRTWEVSSIDNPSQIHRK